MFRHPTLFSAALLTAMALSACSSSAPEPDGATSRADTTTVPTLAQPTPTVTAGSSTTVSDPNPPHGEPGHRCEIAVGASLSTAPPAGTPAPAPGTPTINATPMNIPPAGAPTQTPPGMNPPHGQPGHVCEVPVGSPLPK